MNTVGKSSTKRSMENFTKNIFKDKYGRKFFKHKGKVLSLLYYILNI